MLATLACSGRQHAVVGSSSRPQTPEAIAAWAQERAAEHLVRLGRAHKAPSITAVGATAVSERSADDSEAGLSVLHFELDNGLRVLIMEDDSAPVFAYQTWLGVGSRHERPGITGIAHLFEHLMFKETKNLEEGEFDRLMEAAGAQTNAATWLDWTYYREELPSDQLELAVRLESDRLENMVLGPEQLESEREVVKNERLFRVDNDPEGTMFEMLYATAFKQHPYRWPTVGWMEDIEAITLEDCLAFHQTWYVPNNVTLVIVGDVIAEEALALVAAHYGHLPRRAIPPSNVPTEPTQVAERRALVTMPLSSPKVLYGYRTPPMTDELHPAIHVLHQVLFEGKSSRLFKRLVLDTEKATDAGAWVGEFSDPALYEILITLKRGVDPEVVDDIVNEEMARVAKEPITEAELDKARNKLELEFLRRMQSVGERAYQLGHYATTAGDYELLFATLERIRGVTAADVRRAAQQYLRKNNRSVVIAMPLPDPPTTPAAEGPR